MHDLLADFWKFSMKRCLTFFFFLPLMPLLLATSFAYGYQESGSASAALSPPDPDFSPKGVYEGPLDLPAIVRYPQLPVRMHLEPVIPWPVTNTYLDDRMVPLWQRVLEEATDSDMQQAAAMHLAHVAEQRLANVTAAGPALISLAKSTDEESVRYACAKALASCEIKSAADDLIQYASAGTDLQRLAIEPTLARWKVENAISLWTPRLSDSFTSGVSFRLAAEGLEALNHQPSVDLLSSIAVNRAADFGKRMAASRAIAVLDPAKAKIAAESLISGDPQNRLLALAMLDNVQPESWTTAATLCTDESDAVASAAWQQIFTRQPELLTAHLAVGYQHRDAKIRIKAARVFRLYPDADRTRMLHSLVSDIHIEVRNVARQMLLAVALEHSELREQIISQAAAMLKPESKDWQGIEQSLALLGQLHAPQFSEACFGLLDYPKDEVGISAAWLIHLSPDVAIYDKTKTYIETTESLMSNGKAQGNASLRQALLLQYAGLVRMRELRPLMEKQFPKDPSGSPQKRASALWALGLILERNPEPEVVKKLEQRIKDRSGIPPEHVLVQRASVMALGLMRASSARDTVFESYEIDSQEAGTAGTARWIMPLLGEPMPPDFLPRDTFVGGWRINPTNTPEHVPKPALRDSE